MPTRTLALALIALNLAVYLQVANFEFTQLDDDIYLTENEGVKYGLTLNGLRYAFSTGPAPNSNPLAYVSHMVDVELFGMNPGGHHLSNLALHTVNSVLLLLVLARATRSRMTSFVVAAIFAVHPLHVEPVVWIADRKDVLSAFFWLATIGAYVRYTENAKPHWMAATAGLYTFSLLAKPMAVTLPFVLLLVDVWPLNRLRTAANVRPLLREKIPLFALSALACVATWYLQHSGGAVQDLGNLSVARRMAHAIAAYGIYVRQAFWPVDLGILYPFPKGGPSWPQLGWGIATIGLGTAAALLTLPRRPWIFTGWFWFLGMLVPVIGIVQVGSQLHADRYTYLPLVGLSIAVVFTLAEFAPRKLSLPIVYALALGAIGLLGASAYRQTNLWRNSEVLFLHTLAHCGDSVLIHANLGHYYVARGRLDQAIPHLQAADRLHPGNLVAGYHLAYIDYLNGDFPAAIGRAEGLLAKHPDDYDLCLLLANTHLALGHAEEAVAYGERAWVIRPRSAESSRTLGLSLEKDGQMQRAHEILEAAAQRAPADAGVQMNFANFLARQDRFEEAFRYYDRALDAEPRNAAIYYNMGAAYERAGAAQEAIEAYEAAVNLDPGFAAAATQRKKLLENDSGNR